MRYTMVLAAALALSACTRPNDGADPAVDVEAPDMTPAPSAPDMGHASADLAGAPQLGDMAQAPAGDMASTPPADMAEACGGPGQPCCYAAASPALGACSAGAACMGTVGAPDQVHGGFLCGGRATERCVARASSSCGSYPFPGCGADGLPHGAAGPYCELGGSSGPEGVQGGQCQPCNYPQ